MNDRSAPKGAPGTPAKKSTNSLAEATDQPAPLFGITVDGRETKVEMPSADGVERARRNADPWWTSCTMAAIRAEAASGRIFEPEDLRDRYGLVEPDHPSRWGAAFRQAHRAGIIRPAGAVSSRRRERAGSLTRTWVGAR